MVLGSKGINHLRSPWVFWFHQVDILLHLYESWKPNYRESRVRWWVKSCIAFRSTIWMFWYPWKSKTKQRMVFAMNHVKDSLLPMGKVWSLDFQGYVLVVFCFLCVCVCVFFWRVVWQLVIMCTARVWCICHLYLAFCVWKFSVTSHQPNARKIRW